MLLCVLGSLHLSYFIFSTMERERNRYEAERNRVFRNFVRNRKQRVNITCQVGCSFLDYNYHRDNTVRERERMLTTKLISVLSVFLINILFLFPIDAEAFSSPVRAIFNLC